MASKKTVWKYGKLNPIRKPKFTRRLDINSNNALQNVREATLDSIYNQNLDMNGEFIAVVLKKISAPSSVESDSISFVSRIWDSLGGSGTKPNVAQIKARVPEIHATIPEPEGSSDNKSIDLHTTFTLLPDKVGKSEFEYGELVTVRFYDSSGAYNPQVIGSFKGPNAAVMPEHGGDAKEKVEQTAEPTNRPPSGDKIGSGQKSGNQVASTFVGPVLNEPTTSNHIGKTNVEILDSIPYSPNRVRVHEGITSLPKSSSLLTNIAPRPNFPQRIARIHALVAGRFNALREAASLEGIDVYCQSGWRPHRWKSREDYEEKMIAQYKSVKEGRKWKAYVSSHETGLAIDFYIPAVKEGEYDIAPSQPGDSGYGKRTTSEQKKSTAHKWLRENAHLYGFTPLLNEAWHWECLLPIEAWKTGAEFTSQFDITNYDIRVRETSIANGSRTNQKNFTFE